MIHYNKISNIIIHKPYFVLPNKFSFIYMEVKYIIIQIWVFLYIKTINSIISMINNIKEFYHNLINNNMAMNNKITMAMIMGINMINQ